MLAAYPKTPKTGSEGDQDWSLSLSIVVEKSKIPVAT